MNIGPTVYGITAFRNEYIQYIDEDETLIHGSDFFQNETIDRNVLIKGWAEIMVEDTQKLEDQEFYNVFIHINGVQVFTATTDSIDLIDDTDDGMPDYKTQFRSDINDILLQASIEADLMIKQEAQLQWLKDVDSAVNAGILRPTAGPGRRA